MTEVAVAVVASSGMTQGGKTGNGAAQGHEIGSGAGARHTAVNTSCLGIDGITIHVPILLFTSYENECHHDTKEKHMLSMHLGSNVNQTSPRG